MGLLQLTTAQFGMPGMGMEQPKAAAVKSDVQYIRCQACEAFVKQAYRHTKSQREALRPGQKVGPQLPAMSVAEQNTCACRGVHNLSKTICL